MLLAPAFNRAKLDFEQGQSFCGLSIEDKIPDHSVFSRARNERFRESAIFRRVFERVVEA
jgi:hypothetical protein